MKSFIDKYSIIIDYINMAYHPEFGKVSCSATGYSPEDAILLLREVTKEVVTPDGAYDCGGVGSGRLITVDID